MVELALWEARFRVMAGLTVVASLPLWLPDVPSQRIWALTGICLLAPWLVIGRDATRRRSGFREALRIAPRAGLFVAFDVLPALMVVAAGACVGVWTGPTGSIETAVALTAWGMLITIGADALDRSGARPASTWVVFWVAMVAVWAAPLWSGPWFGRTGATPWIVTVVVGLHPAAVALAASGLATLQDPLFYTFSLAGVVEAHPMSWAYGASAMAVVGIGALGWDVRAARRPHR